MYSRFPAGPGTQESHTPRTAQPLPVANSVKFLQHPPAHARIADDAATDVGAPGLELRLHEHEGAPGGLRAGQSGGEHQAERDERHVGGDEGGPKRQRRAVERPRVRPVDGSHPRVGAKALVELVSPDVERDHGGRAVLEEAVGEPARRGSRRRGIARRRRPPRTRRAPTRASPRRATRTAAARSARRPRHRPSGCPPWSPERRRRARGPP